MVLIRFVNSNYNTKGYVFIISIAINEEMIMIIEEEEKKTL